MGVGLFSLLERTNVLGPDEIEGFGRSNGVDLPSSLGRCGSFDNTISPRHDRSETNFS